jgi:hypothetical protein
LFVDAYCFFFFFQFPNVFRPVDGERLTEMDLDIPQRVALRVKEGDVGNDREGTAWIGVWSLLPRESRLFLRGPKVMVLAWHRCKGRP